MANEVSFSMARNAGAINNLSNGAVVVTIGTAAPGAGDLEVRIASVLTVLWTKKELKQALDEIWRAIKLNPDINL